MKKLDPKILETGDVIVVYGGRGLISRLIAKITDNGTGYWSHCGMACSITDTMQTVVHAEERGVIAVSIEDFMAGRKAWAVMRAKKPFDKELCKTKLYCSLKKPYAYKQLLIDLIAAWWRKRVGIGALQLFKMNPGGYTCSELCAMVLGYFGIQVGPPNRPQLSAPSDFMASHDLVCIDHSEVIRG